MKAYLCINMISRKDDSTFNRKQVPSCNGHERIPEAGIHAPIPVMGSVSQAQKLKKPTAMIDDSHANTVFVSPLLKGYGNTFASIERAVSSEKGLSFQTLDCITSDIWCRDYMPVQVSEDRFVSFEFAPDYLVKHNKDHRYRTKGIVASPGIELGLVIDGGNTVKCDGAIIMTEKVFYENPSMTREQVVRALEEAFESEIIFLPWDRAEIFGHSDGIVHFVGDGTVIITDYRAFSYYYRRKFLQILEKRFNVVELRLDRKNESAWAYVNFLRVGNLALVPQLDKPDDEKAMEQISAALPSCKTVPIPAKEVVEYGGALNCVTWNIFLEAATPLTLQKTLPLEWKFRSLVRKFSSAIDSYNPTKEQVQFMGDFDSERLSEVLPSVFRRYEEEFCRKIRYV